MCLVLATASLVGELFSLASAEMWAVFRFMRLGCAPSSLDDLSDTAALSDDSPPRRADMNLQLCSYNGVYG